MVFCEVRTGLIKAFFVGTTFKRWIIVLYVVVFPITYWADLKCSRRLFAHGAITTAWTWKLGVHKVTYWLFQ